MLPYSINLTWSDEDGGYIATCPEFKNLSAFGETPEEALKEAKIAIEGFLEDLKEENATPPKPVKLSDYSGQIRLRMPRQLHQCLTSAADQERVSLNTFMIYLLSLNYGVFINKLAREEKNPNQNKPYDKSA